MGIKVKYERRKTMEFKKDDYIISTYSEMVTSADILSYWPHYDVHWVNAITDKLNEYLNSGYKEVLKTYDKSMGSYLVPGAHPNALAIRVPGATRGHITLTDDHVIKNFEFYDTAESAWEGDYKNAVNEFIGKKIIMNDKQALRVFLLGPVRKYYSAIADAHIDKTKALEVIDKLDVPYHIMDTELFSPLTNGNDVDESQRFKRRSIYPIADNFDLLSMADAVYYMPGWNTDLYARLLDMIVVECDIPIIQS